VSVVPADAHPERVLLEDLLGLVERRVRDLNPRRTEPPETVFEKRRRFGC
jgi:hypothetical protein